MSDQSEHPVLTVIEGKYANQYWKLTADELTLGREDGCDMIIPERQISRKHLRVFRENGVYYVEDLESRNGTWVNGQRLEGARELFDNDEIHVALVVRLMFMSSAATAPLPFELPTSINGRLQIDRESRRVFVNEVELDPPLSLPQYRLLELLYLHDGRVCTRDHIVNAVWPEVDDNGVSEQAIDALIRRLRDRIHEIDPDVQYILTMRGHGFRLVNPQK
ncbi:MAG: FHA domain-containing protein [Anaerolineae bacterium]|jgi:DNA-binding winged helix-turn-helix (wHTH) protein|nr:FHA domain-containing protein [Anaerolineae bacterium]